jgi:hypothetical protein
MKLVTRVERSYTGWLIGFRKWLLQAYDTNNNLICEVSDWEENNYLKYIKFLIKLRKEYDYDLTTEQRKYIKSEPFLLPEFIPYITKSHLITIANLSGYNESFLDNIRTKTNEEKYKFAYDIGLENDELDKAINSYFNN